MESIEFVEKYNAIVPNKNDLIKLGYSIGLSDEISRKIVPKPSLTIWNNHKDPIISLLNNYNLRGLEIGMIYFNGGIQEIEEYYLFGKVEADPLAINKLSNEILYFELGTSHILGKCAADSFRFLNALLSLHKTFIYIILNKIDMEQEQDFICDESSSCSYLAGGSLYKNFYDLILGCY